jgi:ankyrin repeat protein
MALGHVAATGNLELARSYLRSGADIETRRGELGGKTPLMLAAQGGHAEMVDVLLAHGAAVDAATPNGDALTALDLAVHGNHSAAARALLSHGADVHARHGEGMSTPLHFAAFLGYPELAELLLAHGANVHARGEHRYTPLHSAVQGGHRRVVDLLVAHGADVFASTANGNLAGALPTETEPQAARIARQRTLRSRRTPRRRRWRRCATPLPPRAPATATWCCRPMAESWRASLTVAPAARCLNPRCCSATA